MLENLWRQSLIFNSSAAFYILWVVHISHTQVSCFGACSRGRNRWSVCWNGSSGCCSRLWPASPREAATPSPRRGAASSQALTATSTNSKCCGNWRPDVGPRTDDGHRHPPPPSADTTASPPTTKVSTPVLLHGHRLLHRMCSTKRIILIKSFNNRILLSGRTFKTTSPNFIFMFILVVEKVLVLDSRSRHYIWRMTLIHFYGLEYYRYSLQSVSGFFSSHDRKRWSIHQSLQLCTVLTTIKRGFVSNVN